MGGGWVVGCGAVWPGVEPINHILRPVQHNLLRPMVEARDACEGVASGAAEEVHAKELHVGHGKELFGVKDAISLATSEVYVDCKTLHRGQNFSHTPADSPSIMSGCMKLGQVVRHRRGAG